MFAQIDPSELPDGPIEGYRAPWRVDDAGNGHFYLFDADSKPIFHVYCWDGKDIQKFIEKMRMINSDDNFDL